MKKHLMKMLSAIYPSYFAQVAYGKLVNPQIRKIRDHEEKVLAIAEQSDIQFNDFLIKTYTWSGDRKPILLVHGWEGQAGNFSDIINYLIAKGHTVYAFDGPSHGHSSIGQTSLFEYSDLVGYMIEFLHVEWLISHSFGGVATTFALFRNQHLRLKKYVLLTTPDSFEERLDYVFETVGISSRVKPILRERFQNELGLKIEDMRVSQFVKNIKVDKALIIHDKNDKVIPVKQSESVINSWKNGILETIEGTGHFKILRKQFVIERLYQFLINN